jgi:hypothetical protein
MPRAQGSAGAAPASQGKGQEKLQLEFPHGEQCAQAGIYAFFPETFRWILACERMAALNFVSFVS